MQKLANPFLANEGYHCFGCSPANDHGLQMEFYEADESVVSIWQPRRQFEGFDTVLHGGVQATLMDELASWYVFVKRKTAGVTSGMEIRFHKPVLTDGGPLRLEATLDGIEGRLAHINVSLEAAPGDVCSEGTITYFIYSERVARRRLGYPGYEAFLSDGPAGST
jgi:acyl-coenzyme A thioesterase PaaI-like protein